jgi:hypothetical protein
MGNNDRYRGVADTLVAALGAAGGDPAKEEAALKAAIAGYLEASEQPGVDPAELGVAEYFAEDGTADDPPALERVKGATEDDIFRWREKLADLAGY